MSVTEIRKGASGQHAKLSELLGEIETLDARLEKVTENEAGLGRELRGRGLTRPLLPTLFFSVLMAPFVAGATFHLWDITEVYSNGDGSVQFIELATGMNNQDELVDHTLVADPLIFTFPTDLDPDEMGDGNNATANQHMLVATPAFASQPGAVTPDFVLDGPAFFDFVEDSLDFAGVNTFGWTSGELPTNSIDSLHEPFGSNVRTVDINSPTNFAGEVGELPEPSGALTLGVGACLLALLRRVTGRESISIECSEKRQKADDRTTCVESH